MNKYGLSKKRIWLGETGSVSGGGLEGFSNAYSAGFL